MFNTIDKMKHFIRTSYGASNEFYSRHIHRFHGILQGNGAGPAIWAMVSTPILDQLRHKGFGVTIQSLSPQQALHIPAFAFVDDTDLILEIKDQDNLEIEVQNVL
jgi:hypothetical protein